MSNEKLVLVNDPLNDSDNLRVINMSERYKEDVIIESGSYRNFRVPEDGLLLKFERVRTRKSEKTLLEKAFDEQYKKQGVDQ